MTAISFDPSRRKALKSVGAGLLLLNFSSGRIFAQRQGDFGKKALEVTEYLQRHFWDSKSDLYRAKAGEGDPDYIWGGGVMFSALVGATRHDRKFRMVMRKFFNGLEGYWDDKVEIPGYEPARTGGGGSDKYYDDNAWMVITYLEAYEVTKESRYLKKAAETLRFVLSGWDDHGGGGLWWHEQRRDGTKTTCSNAPAAVGCLRLAKFREGAAAEKLVEEAKKIVEWTVKNLQAPNGLFGDSIKPETGAVNRDQLTYNAALMLRAFIGLHAWTGERKYLNEAKRIGKAGQSLLGGNGVYRDEWKWAHLMVEADIELYRWTKERDLLERARKNCEGHYAAWQEKKPEDLITNASLARELWLMADMETPEGRRFWEESDRLK